MHPIIALWSHPRSMSTAMERMMRERGDLWCAHEPFMYDYYVGRGVRRMPAFEVQPDHPVDYADIRDMLLARAAAGPVFFKDMAYYVVPRILDDPAFLGRLTHAFLIRDPVAAILSYHKLDPQVTCEEIGLEAEWQLYQAVGALGRTPPVIEAEAVRADPRGTMRAFWAAVGLEWCGAAFDWQEVPQDWAQVAGWHGSVAASDGIRPADPDEARRKRALFADRVNAAPHLRAYLAHHAPFYERLRAVAAGS